MVPVAHGACVGSRVPSSTASFSARGHAPCTPALPGPGPCAAGYGNSGPQQCWAAAAVITVQAICCTVVLNAVVLGIILAKVGKSRCTRRLLPLLATAAWCR